MENRFAQQLKKGVLDMVVLKLICEKDSYGYELLQELEKKGESFCSGKKDSTGRENEDIYRQKIDI